MMETNRLRPDGDVKVIVGRGRPERHAPARWEQRSVLNSGVGYSLAGCRFVGSMIRVQYANALQAGIPGYLSRRRRREKLRLREV